MLKENAFFFRDIQAFTGFLQLHSTHYKMPKKLSRNRIVIYCPEFRKGVLFFLGKIMKKRACYKKVDVYFLRQEY